VREQERAAGGAVCVCVCLAEVGAGAEVSGGQCVVSWDGGRGAEVGVGRVSGRRGEGPAREDNPLAGRWDGRKSDKTRGRGWRCDEAMGGRAEATVRRWGAERACKGVGSGSELDGGRGGGSGK
jgi:hypothetical protein